MPSNSTAYINKLRLQCGLSWLRFAVGGLRNATGLPAGQGVVSAPVFGEFAGGELKDCAQAFAMCAARAAATGLPVADGGELDADRVGEGVQGKAEGAAASAHEALA